MRYLALSGDFVCRAGLSQAAALHAACFPKAWSAQEIADMLAIKGTYGSLAVSGEDALGFILCRALFEDAELLTLAVLPIARRQGIAKALLEKAVQEARMLGATRMLLEVSSDNSAARQLYHSQGFTRTGMREGYYRSGEQAKDALLMECCFP